MVNFGVIGIINHMAIEVYKKEEINKDFHLCIYIIDDVGIMELITI